MLEGLDAVNWAALGQGDVPDLLRALRSPDPAAGEQAQEALFGTIVHQGTRYAATAPAVPFLAELALAPDTPDRHRLVELLTYAAIGYDQESLPAGILQGSLDELARTTNTPGDEQKYGPWALAAYQAVQAAVPPLLPLLEEDDVRLRRAVAHLVAWFPRWAPRSLPRLRVRLAAEPDPDAKATMLVAVGLLAGAQGQTDDAPRLTELLGDADAVVRWAAAVALARLFPQAPPQPAVGELLGWLTGKAAPQRQPEILFCEPEEYALLVMQSVPVLRERAVGAILDRLPTLRGGAAHSLVCNLVDLAFESDRPPPGVAFAELAPPQQRVLRALVEMPALWRAEGDRVPPVFPLFSHWGSFELSCTLEELPEQLRAYVGARGPDAAAHDEPGS
jgi:hypothetical protein